MPGTIDFTVRRSRYWGTAVTVGRSEGMAVRSTGRENAGIGMWPLFACCWLWRGYFDDRITNAAVAGTRHGARTFNTPGRSDAKKMVKFSQEFGNKRWQTLPYKSNLAQTGLMSPAKSGEKIGGSSVSCSGAWLRAAKK